MRLRQRANSDDAASQPLARRGARSDDAAGEPLARQGARSDDAGQESRVLRTQARPATGQCAPWLNLFARVLGLERKLAAPATRSTSGKLSALARMRLSERLETGDMQSVIGDQIL